jgi:hypothetical protein
MVPVQRLARVTTGWILAEDFGEKVAHHEVVAVGATLSFYKVSMAIDDALPFDQTTCP